MPTPGAFTFICGQDDFLVDRLGRERFAALGADEADEFAKEVISGFVANGEELEASLRRFREAVQTLPLFGGRRLVWLKDVNFLADATATGRAEGTLDLVEDLQQILQSADPSGVAILVTAAPIDRRRSFYKWCEANADFTLVDEDGDRDGALLAFVRAEAAAIGATLGRGAAERLVAKIGPTTRLLAEELRKLATHSPEIGKELVSELTPDAAEGDFFEAAEAFFSGELTRTLDAFHRHFFSGGDARPLLVSLQNRNRIILQARALIDAREATLGPRGLSIAPETASARRAAFGEAAGEKSSYNLFTQNSWYVGKLCGAEPPSLRRLIDNQREFITAFERILGRNDEQEEILRDLAVRCLT